MNKYIILIKDESPITSDFISDEMFPDHNRTTVIDTHTGTFTTNGKDWFGMNDDHI